MDEEPKALDESKAHGELRALLVELAESTIELIQLRDKPFHHHPMYSPDDIDFLASPLGISLLLDKARLWVMAGRCHLWVRRTSGDKVQVALFSMDGRCSVTLDLWVCMRQLTIPDAYVSYESCENAVQPQGTNVFRLPLKVEFALFLHHLIKKRRNVSLGENVRRLEDYLQMAKNSADQKLSAVISSVLRARSVDDHALVYTREVIIDSGIAVYEQTPQKLQRKAYKWLRDAILAGPRSRRYFSIIGVDGVGKTTLIEQLKGDNPGFASFTGKHLYRKNWFYKLFVGIVRPLTGANREGFDEKISGLTYPLAALGLFKLCFRFKRKCILIDRCIVDFLLLNRKTSRPKFSRLFFLRRCLGSRIPTVHLYADSPVVLARKREMTKEGIDAYNGMMFAALSQHNPTDYALFNNSAGPESSAESLSRVLLAIQRGS